MASADTTPSTDVDGSTVKKTVTVIAYAPYGAFKSVRDMADDLDATTDYYERDYRRDESVELVALDDEGDEIQAEPVYCPDLRDALKAADIDGNVEVRVTNDVSRPYAHDPDSVARSTRTRLARKLPKELPGGVERGIFAYKWQDSDAMTRVHIRSDGIDSRRVMAHRTRRNGRRKWDTDRKHLSMAFTIELGPSDPRTVTTWSDMVVRKFVDMLVDEHWVERVRVADCTETVEREGDCFDI